MIGEILGYSSLKLVTHKEINNFASATDDFQWIHVDEKKAVNLVLKPGEMSLHHGAVIHGSKPNKSKQRRIGFALQSYCPHAIKQIIGKNIWLKIRGGKRNDHDSLQLHRPQYDMDPVAVDLRKIANQNYSNILYNDAKITRKY